MWNALPLDIREKDNIEKFKQRFKTLLFEGTIKFVEHAFITNWIYTVTEHFSSNIYIKNTLIKQGDCDIYLGPN